MTRWIDRRFEYEPPVGEYPMILERLRGTPARATERVRFIPETVLTRRDGDAWSPQEHIGHLLDLESLWATRVEEFLRGAPELTAADMSNRRTHEANHNARSIHALLAEFTVARAQLLARLDAASNPAVSAIHPRLKRAMRLIDFCFFMAEHDDHHLAIITRLLSA
ncbi:MAG TPA: DinB family protein [Candidatus Krumholzibacteria bacterium]|nr:DinB family protein [Candidatus Krumholzibacteria bacterium]